MPEVNLRAGACGRAREATITVIHLQTLDRAVDLTAPVSFRHVI